MRDAPVRIVLVEDHALMRLGLRTVLSQAGFLICGEADTAADGLRLVAQHGPQIAVVDLQLRHGDGLSLIREIARTHSPTRIIVLTMSEQERDIRAALSAGADAYCVKASAPNIVLDAVAAVAAGGAYFDPAIAHRALRELRGHARGDDESTEALAPREIEILRLVAQGRSNAEIAAQLRIGYGTVKGHIADILEKLAAADRAQAAVIGYQRGLL